MEAHLKYYLLVVLAKCLCAINLETIAGEALVHLAFWSHEARQNARSDCVSDLCSDWTSDLENTGISSLHSSMWYKSGTRWHVAMFVVLLCLELVPKLIARQLISAVFSQFPLKLSLHWHGLYTYFRGSFVICFSKTKELCFIS